MVEIKLCINKMILQIQCMSFIQEILKFNRNLILKKLHIMMISLLSLVTKLIQKILKNLKYYNFKNLNQKIYIKIYKFVI